ncbi:MAG TPA: restriction endonuclease [Nitrosopumilus sp.]|nr:restriction endonuclease [Nitrosopumilus sp.]
MMVISSDLSLLDNTSGREFELFIIDLFEKLGYSSTVTNRSKDNGFSILLKQGEYIIAVQAKRSESELSFTSVQRALDSLKKYNAQFAIVVTNNKFISSAKQLAKIKSVSLIDRKKLLDLIELSNLPVNHKKDLIFFCEKICKDVIKHEMDKQTLQFLGLDVPKIDHSLLTKDAYGRPYPINNKKEKLIDIFKEIRGDEEMPVQKDILLNFMEKFPLMYGTRNESEIFLTDMIKELMIFKLRDDHYNLV